MLEALPAAQSSGQKAQEDALLGQGSIFDIGAGGDDRQSVQRPPISAAEFDRRELLGMEKETMGTYLSSHPLAEVRDALRARVDCTVAELAGKSDGTWVTVGGIVTERKRIRTKNNTDMMFATLDDVEGQVEMLVFNSAYASNADTIDTDVVVLVRGRVDHKERGETKLVVQEAERFQPAAEEMTKAAEIAARRDRPLTLRVVAADFPPTLLDELKSVFEHFPGETEVLLEMQTREGKRTLRFGADYKVRDSGPLRAELAELRVLGPGVIAA
jgi:DNA polymerase-3 subunit alpha